MKKTVNKLAAIVLCLALCLSLAACSMDLGSGMLVVRACEAMSKVESFRFSASADALGRALEEDVTLTAKADGSCVLEPTVLEMEAELRADGADASDTLSAPIYAVAENGGVTLYVGMDLLGKTIWIKQTLNMTEDAVSGSVEQFISYMKDNVKSIAKGKAEQINGKTATPLTVVIPGEVLAQSAAPGGSAQPEELTLTIWIDKESSLPVRVESEMDELARYYLAGMDLGFLNGTEVESLTLRIDLSDFNTVESITLPEAAKNAVSAQ